MMLQARRSEVPASGAPVGDAVLSRLYRADAAGIAEIAAGLSRETRAQLAGFCFARAHLRSIGREIARHCDDAALLHCVGGAFGACLVEAKRNDADVAEAQGARAGRPRVTLASAADMRRREPLVDVDDAVE